MLRVESFEYVIDDDICITPEDDSMIKVTLMIISEILWEHPLDHIHQLRLTDFPLGEIYPEAVPESHDVKLCELIILNKMCLQKMTQIKKRRITKQDEVF